MHNTNSPKNFTKRQAVLALRSEGTISTTQNCRLIRKASWKPMSDQEKHSCDLVSKHLLEQWHPQFKRFLSKAKLQMDGDEDCTM